MSAGHTLTAFRYTKVQYWPDEVIALLQTGTVAVVSPNHDLGDDERGTGYDVITWIQEAVAMRGFVPPGIMAHSSNSSAVAKMQTGIQAVQRLADRRHV